MKKIIFALSLSFATAGAFAQNTESYPYWTISKDVQKVQFKNMEYVPAVATTGNLENTVSKGVARLQKKSDSQNRVRVEMTGMPSSVISKGVARMQYEKSVK